MEKGTLTIMNAGDTSPLFIPSPRMTIAAAAMQGLLASNLKETPAFVARMALRYADALLTELELPYELEKPESTPQRDV